MDVYINLHIDIYMKNYIPQQSGGYSRDSSMFQYYLEINQYNPHISRSKKKNHTSINRENVFHKFRAYSR